MKKDLVGVAGEWGRRTKDKGEYGDGSETGSLTEKKENKHRRPVSVPASLWTSGIKRRITVNLHI